jgi:histidine triad (HIT) family protein
MDCIFCKIVRKEIPSYLVFEDKTSIAFLDINPFVKGHTLVVPKKHSRWVWDSTEDEYIELMKSVRKVALQLKKTLHTDWIQVVVAGQEVPHTHIHLLPRTENDGYPEIPIRPITQLSGEEMKEIQKKIKNSS